MRNKKFSLLFLSFIFLFSCFLPVRAENKRIKITVAIPIYEGNDSSLQEQYITGYTHEYLTKLAQVAPIDFEFIHYKQNNEEILDTMEKVKNGSIDFIDGMLKGTNYDSEYLFSAKPVGYVNTSLMALKDNKMINERVLQNHEAVTVGLQRRAAQSNASLQEYLQQENLNINTLYYETGAEVRSALDKGEIDAFVGRDISKAKDCKIVVNLKEQPFFLSSSLENSAKMKIIDAAMEELELIDPDYKKNLHKKYFGEGTADVSLTKEEIQFSSQLDILKVGLIPDHYPLQFFDVNGKPAGILVDLMNIISEETGLKIQYIKIKNLENIKEDFESNDIDMILGVPLNYEQAAKNEFLLSSSIVQLPIVRIINRNSAKSDKTVMSGYLSLSSDFEKISNDHEIFNMISSGKYKDAFIDGYRAQYYSASFNNIEISPSTYDNYEVGIGLYNKKDYRIMSIIEQGIRGISRQQIDDIIYRNVMIKEDFSFMNFIKRNPTQAIVMVFGISGLVIGILSLFLYKSNHMKKVIAEERRKYALLAQYDQLTNLYNQETFKKIVQEDMNNGKSGILVAMDLDNFKSVNDIYGHFEGDKLLALVGKLLNQYFGQYTVGRAGGDEFMIYLGNTQNRKIAEELLNQFRASLKEQDLEFECTVSAGVSVFEKAAYFDEVYCHVDNLLYDIKRYGRDGVKIEDFK